VTCPLLIGPMVLEWYSSCVLCDLSIIDWSDGFRMIFVLCFVWLVHYWLVLRFYYLQYHTQKIKDWVTGLPQKPRYSVKINSFFYTSDIRRVIFYTNPVKDHEGGKKDGIVTTTNRWYTGKLTLTVLDDIKPTKETRYIPLEKAKTPNRQDNDKLGIVCPSSIYGFWLPLWYLNCFLKLINFLTYKLIRMFSVLHNMHIYA
jgi:hypothetical protein